MTAPGEMLFVYGTLLESQVQEYVFGHPLEGVPDTLPGHIKKDKSVLDAYPGLQQASAALPPVTGMRL